ncbi:Ig-like domain-containing protein [Propionibacteriaceae bacterium Y1700]|uniref:Ig-like domain-containing protein n=1 Tax=Microlunatus sp. Y1700 TaxID=3418487 RepID=UPI003DA6FAF5
MSLALLTLAPPGTARAAGDVVVPGSVRVISYQKDLPLERWWSARIGLDWDTARHRVRAGDSFTVEVGPEFAINSLATFPLTVSSRATAGECAVAPRSDTAPPQVTCTFNDFVDDHDQLSGSIWFHVQAIRQVTDDQVTVRVNGASIRLDLPSSKGIVAGGPYRPTRTGAVGWWADPQHTTLDWFVHIVPKGRTWLEFDQQVSAGHTIDLDSVTVARVSDDDQAWYGGWWEEVPAANWQFEGRGRQMHGVLTGLQPGHIYRIAFRSTVDASGELSLGDAFTTTSMIDGRELRTVVTVDPAGEGRADVPADGGGAGGQGETSTPPGGATADVTAASGTGPTAAADQSGRGAAATSADPGVPAGVVIGALVTLGLALACGVVAVVRRR